MSENDLIKSQNRTINRAVNTISKPISVQVIGFDIKPKPGTSREDVNQYERTIIELVKAGLPRNQLETCLEIRGDKAQTVETSGFLQEEPQIISNVAHGPNGIVAFRFREETIPATNQLPTALETGNEIMDASKSPSIIQQPTQTHKKVLEFIRVILPEQPQLSDDTPAELPQPDNSLVDQNRQNNPFLQTVVGDIDYKKAA